MARITVWLAVVGTVSMLLVACGGGGGADKPIPGIAAVTATRDDVNGAPGLTSTIRVAFDAAFEQGNTTVPLASLFEIDAPDPRTAQSTRRRILVQSAEREKESTRSVLLHVKELVPAGSTLKVAKNGLKKGETGELTASIASDIGPLQSLLATGALSFDDPSLLDDTRKPTLTDADRNPVALRKVLEVAIQQRGGSEAVRKRAVDRFDAMPTDVIPNPRARAALALLTGTFAEPAIDYLLTNDNCTGKPAALIDFQPPPDAPQLFARVTFTKDGRRVVSINPRIEQDRIEHIAPILAHEAIHCDAQSGKFEEVAATAFDSYLYLLFAATNPEITLDGTFLTKEQNVDAVAMINSGRAIPESIGILPSPGVAQAVPGTNSRAGSFADLVAAAYQGLPNETPDEPLAQAYVTVIARALNLKAGSAFNLRYLDDLLGRAIPSEALIAAVQALRLSPDTP